MTSSTKSYDIVIVGGGIHGVGVAQAAAAAGAEERRRTAEGEGGAELGGAHAAIRHGGLVEPCEVPDARAVGAQQQQEGG